MKNARKGRVWLTLSALAVVGVAIWLLVTQTARQPPPQVVVAPVMREDLVAAISSNGKVEPIEPHVVLSRLTSFVETVSAVEGKSVKRGDFLLGLDSSDARAEVVRLREELMAADEALRTAQAGGKADELAQLESELRRSDAEVSRLQQQAEVFERLIAKQAATAAELDQTTFSLGRAREESRLLREKKEDLAKQATYNASYSAARVQGIKDSIRRQEEIIASARVLAPAEGVLYLFAVKAGSFVRTGDPLAELADLRRVRVRAFVDEPELSLLARDQEVEITWDAYPGRVWQGRLERLPVSVVSRGTRSVGEALCSVRNEGLELLPNVSVNVRVLVRQLSHVLTVPRGAVRAEGRQRHVFVVVDDKLRRREIKPGTVSATRYEVLEGLTEGDRVVLSGDSELQDGMAVRVTEQK